MFETEFDVTDDSSTSTETLETADDSAVESGSDDQSTVQGDIQDTSQSEQTIPYDRFKELNDRVKAAEAREQKYLELLSTPKSQQAAIKEQEVDEFADLDPDGYSENKDVIKIATRIAEKIANNIVTERLKPVEQRTQEEQRRIWSDQVVTAKNTYSDFDDVFNQVLAITETDKALDIHIMSHPNPIEYAYEFGKNMLRKSTSKPTAASIAKQSGTPAAKPKPVVANEIKGGNATNPSSEEDRWLRENFNSLP